MDKKLIDEMFAQRYVVLTENEWETLHNDHAKALYNARKKAVREFVMELKKKLYTNNYCQEIVREEHIDEIAKQFGVEVK